MRSYSLICGRRTLGKETIIYNKILIKSGERYKTYHEKYLKQKIVQFYDFVISKSKEK